MPNGHNISLQCGVCESDKIDTAVSVDRVNCDLEKVNIQYYICKSCGCVFHNNLMFMPKEHYQISYHNNPIRVASLTKTLDYLISYMPNHNGLTSLEVGCGNGNLMLLLRESGFGVTGIDLSVTAQSEGRKKGLNIFSDTESFVPGQFDLLILNHVIEHVMNPAEFILKFLPYLKDDGIIYVEVPSIEFLASGCDSAYNNLYPNHIYHFSPNGIVNMMESMGCSFVANQHHHYSDYPSMMGLFQKKDVVQYSRVRFEEHLRCEQDIVETVANTIQHQCEDYPYLVIWGCSDEAYQILKRLAPEVIAKTILIDSSPAKIGKELLSLQIRAPEYLKDINKALFLVAPTSTLVANNIKHSIEKLSSQKHSALVYNRRVSPYISSL